MLLKQLLSKAPNDVVKQSVEFSEKSLFKDPQSYQYKVGVALDAYLVTNLKHNFAELQAGNDINKAALAELYKQFGDAMVRHLCLTLIKH